MYVFSPLSTRFQKGVTHDNDSSFPPKISKNLLSLFDDDDDEDEEELDF